MAARPTRSRSSRTVRVGLSQMACGPDPAVNLERQLALAERALKGGARIFCTQELFRSQYFCQAEKHDYFRLAEPVPGPSTRAFQALARKFGAIAKPLLLLVAVEMLVLVSTKVLLAPEAGALKVTVTPLTGTP